MQCATLGPLHRRGRTKGTRSHNSVKAQQCVTPSHDSSARDQDLGRHTPGETRGVRGEPLWTRYRSKRTNLFRRHVHLCVRRALCAEVRRTQVRSPSDNRHPTHTQLPKFLDGSTPRTSADVGHPPSGPVRYTESVNHDRKRKAEGLWRFTEHRYMSTPSTAQVLASDTLRKRDKTSL